MALMAGHGMRSLRLFRCAASRQVGAVSVETTSISRGAEIHSFSRKLAWRYGGVSRPLSETRTVGREADWNLRVRYLSGRRAWASRSGDNGQQEKNR